MPATEDEKRTAEKYGARKVIAPRWARPQNNLIPVDPTRNLGPKGFDDVDDKLDALHEAQDRVKSDAAHLASFPPVDESNKPIFIGTQEEYDELKTNEAVDPPFCSTGIPKGNQAEAMRRKGIPIATGVIDYFPLALAEVAKVSRVGNDQHNPGQSLHWNRDLSGDESDALMRHFLERGSIDSDGCRHSGKVAWRALALLQKELENAQST